MSTDSGALSETVRAFIATEVGVKLDRLTPATRLMRDLNIDGADGWGLIEAFARKFSVDIADFDSVRHFGPEAGCNPVTYVIHRIVRPDSLKFVQITVSDLEHAARRANGNHPLDSLNDLMFKGSWT